MPPLPQDTYPPEEKRMAYVIRWSRRWIGEYEDKGFEDEVRQVSVHTSKEKGIEFATERFHRQMYGSMTRYILAEKSSGYEIVQARKINKIISESGDIVRYR